jgi:hypothetical protein
MGTPVTLTEMVLEGDAFAFEPIDLPLVLNQGELHSVEVTVSPESQDSVSGTLRFLSDTDVLQEVELGAN